MDRFELSDLYEMQWSAVDRDDVYVIQVCQLAISGCPEAITEARRLLSEGLFGPRRVFDRFTF